MTALTGIRVVGTRTRADRVRRQVARRHGRRRHSRWSHRAAIRARSYPPFLDDTPGDDRSLYWWHYHTSKRGIVLDLDTEDSLGPVCKSLLASADVLLNAEPRGRLAGLGVAADALGHLIHVCVTPYGLNDPKSDLPFTDLTLMAASGPPWSCGYDDHDAAADPRRRVRATTRRVTFAVLSTLTALLHRKHTGEGQLIDVSMTAASNVTTEAASYSWLVAGQTVQRQTGRHAAVKATGPTQQLCGDGRHVNTGVPPRFPDEFKRLYAWLEELGLIEEFPEAVFLEMGANWEGPFDLSKLHEDDTIAAIFGAGRDALKLIGSRVGAQDFLRRLPTRRARGRRAVNAPEEAFEDEHFRARGFQVPVHHEELDRTITYPGAPYALTGSPWAYQPQGANGWASTPTRYWPSSSCRPRRPTSAGRAPATAWFFSSSILLLREPELGHHLLGVCRELRGQPLLGRRRVR